MENFDIFKLDGHTLRVFLGVYETGSVSKAADLFDLNQSTISHTLDKMRAAIGDPLFVKSGRGITPTEATVSLVPKVQDLLGRLEGLVAVGDYNAQQDSPPFSVAVATPGLMPMLKQVYEVLKDKAPLAPFHVARLAPRERMAEMLTLGEVDLAICIHMERYPATLSAAHYGADDLVVYYDPECRDPVRSAKEYGDAQHAVAGFGGRTKSLVEIALEGFGLQRQVAFVSPTVSTLGPFLKGTQMIATMPRCLAENVFEGLAFAPPPIPLPPLSYDLVWHKRFEHSGRNMWFRALVLEHAAVPQYRWG